MAKTTLNNSEQLVFCQKSINAVVTYKSLLTTFPFSGGTTTPAKLQAVFQADIDATNALDAAEANVTNLRIKQKAARAASMALHTDVKKFLEGNKVPDLPQVMLDFGYAAPKPRTQTVASKAEAIAQAKATREARGTMGSKQKEGADFDEPLRALGVVELAAVA